MTVLRSSALLVAFVAALGCGSGSTVTGPSQAGLAGAGAPTLASGTNGVPLGVTNGTVGSAPAGTTPTAAAAASNAMSPVVAMSMVNKPATPPTGAVPAGTGTPGAATPGTPSGAPGIGVPAGGVPPGAAGGTAPAGGAPAGPPGEPIIPDVKGDCPDFNGGVITFMGLGGINVVAGAAGSGEKKAPFVFYWHGTGSFAAEYATMAVDVSAGVMQEGGVMVSFDGSTGGDLLSGTAIFGKGDFDIGDQLLACAVKNHNVDPKRVFATGCSAGGLFSGAMAAARSNYMAAVAPNSGGWTAPVAFQNMWTPALMTIHGAPGSDVVIVDFSETSATADKAFKMRGGFVMDCNHGGGHCGGGGLAPDIWKFFEAHPYGTQPSPWKDALPSGFNPVCKIQ